jgi:4-amino-4-deoxy-L-arabinose transferase-like glycosyltransferase
MSMTPSSERSGNVPWWREREIAVLLVFVLSVYFMPTRLPLRGEEPTRAQIAFEMVESGDWVVPRQQGIAFGFRPPLQNWLIGASHLVFGNWSAWTVRFHSVAATLLTTLVIYGYSRTFLSRLGALAASAAFATMADLFQMGRQAETEAIFILLVSSSLLVWHGGIMGGWPDGRTFITGYSLMALATLTKGIQAPMYFIGSVGLYLIVTGQWRRLFGSAHGWGIAAAAAILLAWIVPYASAMGWSAVPVVWFGDPAVSSGNLLNWRPGQVAVHLLTYPLEIAAGTLPWSLMLLVFLRRDFRQSIGEARPQVLFLVICLTVAFPTCWLPPGGQPRFFAPLFPCLAILIGFAIQRSALAATSSNLRGAWRSYLAVMAGGMFLAAAAIAVLSIGVNHSVLSAWAEPPLIAFGYVALSVGLAVLVLRVRSDAASDRASLAVAAIALFMAVSFGGIATNVRLRRSENAPESMRLVKDALPPGQQLVSFGGRIDALFAFLYGDPIIEPRPWPSAANDVPADLTYFCFPSNGAERPHLPFPWKEIGAVPMDRNRRPIPERVIVVGQRLSTPLAATAWPNAASAQLAPR